MDTIMKKRGRPLGTDQPRDKYVVIRVSAKEKAAIQQCFKTAPELRDVIMTAVREKIAQERAVPGD